MAKQLIIFGGSGFVGQALCRLAVENHVPTVSISKHGKPLKAGKFADSPLMTWVKADIFNETAYDHYVKNAFAVVNLIGIIKEEPEKQLTYYRMIVTANQLISKQVKQDPTITYLFLSASSGGPLTPPEYLASKRLAEKELAHLKNPVIILRPGLITSWSKPSSVLSGWSIHFLALFPRLGPAFKAVKPIKLRLVSALLLKYAYTETSGLIDLTKKRPALQRNQSL